MSPRVIKDLDHPDFPHGTTKGYARNCKRPCCVRAHRHAKYRYQLDPGRRMVDSGPSITRVQAWLDQGVAFTEMERVVKVSASSLSNLMLRRPSAVNPNTAKRILAVPAGFDFSPVSTQVDPKLSIDLIRQMQAHGYSLRYLAGELGEGPGSTQPQVLAHVNRTCLRTTQDKVIALHARIGAGPPGPSTRSAMVARRLGYHPPACYEDGVYVPGSDPMEVKVKRTKADTTSRILDALHEVLRTQCPVTEAASKFDVSHRSISRHTTSWGLLFEHRDGYTRPTAESDWVADVVVGAINDWRGGLGSREVLAEIPERVAEVRQSREGASGIAA